MIHFLLDITLYAWVFGCGAIIRTQKRVIKSMRELVDRHNETNRSLRNEITALRLENARLKGEPIAPRVVGRIAPVRRLKGEK